MKGSREEGEDKFLAALVNKTATRIVMNLKMVRAREDDGIRETDRARGSERKYEKETGNKHGGEEVPHKQEDRVSIFDLSPVHLYHNYLSIDTTKVELVTQAKQI